MSARPFIAALALLSLTACDYRFSPKDAAEADTRHLCQIYNGQLGKNRDNPDIKAELEKRGKARCIDPVVAEHRRTGEVMGALFGPLGAGIHALASPEPD